MLLELFTVNLNVKHSVLSIWYRTIGDNIIHSVNMSNYREKNYVSIFKCSSFWISRNLCLSKENNTKRFVPGKSVNSLVDETLHLLHVFSLQYVFIACYPVCANKYIHYVHLAADKWFLTCKSTLPLSHYMAKYI